MWGGDLKISSTISQGKHWICNIRELLAKEGFCILSSEKRFVYLIWGAENSKKSKSPELAELGVCTYRSKFAFRARGAKVPGLGGRIKIRPQFNRTFDPHLGSSFDPNFVYNSITIRSINVWNSDSFAAHNKRRQRLSKAKAWTSPASPPPGHCRLQGSLPRLQPLPTQQMLPS